MKEGFFRNKRILVTGHTGFKGSWLTLWLNTIGADVVGFSLDPPSNPYLYKFFDSNLREKLTNIRGDIRKATDISRVVKEYEPEIVFHLAAQPILRSSYKHPVTTYITNTIGTLNLLDALRKFGDAKAIVNVTTDKVYANLGKKHAYKEDEKLGGNDPYSSSKACSELITQAYYQSFFSGIGVATARAGNVIGGGDWGKYRIVPYLLSSQTQNKTIIIRKEDQNAIRPWTYILDILNGYLTLGEKLYRDQRRYSGAWNFASGYVKTVRNLLDEFSKYWNIKYTIKESRIQEEKVLLLNSMKSRTELGWKPIVNFERGVKDTAYWYSYFYTNHRKDQIYKYSLGLLNDFRNRLHG
ncbi:MAG: CDP-glucose 4,6-dehydratase [Thermoplasmata archaeon]